MGKKSRKTSRSASCKKARNPVSNNPPPVHAVVTFIAEYLKLADFEKLPLENYFSHHRHSVSSCDGDGAYNLLSLFVLNPKFCPPGTAEMGIITTICMRVHDNIRNTIIIPNDSFEQILKIGSGKTMDEYYDAYVESVRNGGGNPFRAAPYTHCKRLVNECLLRMKTKKKVLVGKEEKTVVRLFGLESEDAFHRQGESTYIMPRQVIGKDRKDNRKLNLSDLSSMNALAFTFKH